MSRMVCCMVPLLPQGSIVFRSLIAPHVEALDGPAREHLEIRSRRDLHRHPAQFFRLHGMLSARRLKKARDTLQAMSVLRELIRQTPAHAEQAMLGDAPEVLAEPWPVLHPRHARHVAEAPRAQDHQTVLEKVVRDPE